MQHDEEHAVESLYTPRRTRHRRPPISLSRIIEYMFGSFRLKKPLQQAKKHSVMRPSQLAKTSRYRLRRRQRRLRLRRKLILIKYTKRVAYTFVSILLTLFIVFWAKFAIVYHVPSYMQTGQLQDAAAYLVYKSWWFGPPQFNLAAYTNIDPQNPIQSLALQLQRYQDIITNHQEILYVWLR